VIQDYGYDNERNWKVEALVAILKTMRKEGNDEAAFMKDYTYNLVEGQEYSFGVHILEVRPSISASRPRIKIHHLGIGMNEKNPVRLVFEGKAGKTIVASLIDVGGRMRLIFQDIETVKPIFDMLNLAVDRVMWHAMPNLTTGAECWITAGGAHHTVLSYDVDATMLHDWARIMDIEFIHIDKDSAPEKLKQELLVNGLVGKLK